MSAAPAPNDDKLFVFDLARALAAFVVLIAHARSFILLDAAQQPSSTTPAARLVFGLTALGHQAVIVFFVVSGALVTRAMLAMHRRGRWSATRFATARLVRIWVVLIPCLLLGGLQDRLGLALGEASGLAGYGTPGSGAATIAGQLGGGTLAGNIAFLQGFTVPTFGSNLPLWTLAVEAWCYVFGFGLFVLWRARRIPLALAGHGLWLAVLGLGLLTPRFWLLLPIWLMGAALALVLPAEGGSALPGHSHLLARVPQPRRRIAAVMMLGVALIGARAVSAHHQVTGDYLLAGATALALLAFSDWRPASRKFIGATRFAAGFSYTLYLSHYPLLALFAATVLGNRQLAFGASSLVLMAAAVAVAIVQAIGLWWLFERHTSAVKAAVQGWLGRRAAPRLSGPRELTP